MPSSIADSSTVSMDIRLPAAVLKLWHQAGKAGPAEESDLGRLIPKEPGFHDIGAGTVAVTAESGDPALFDTAVYVGEHLIEGARRRGIELSVLILPGEVVRSGGEAALTADPLIEGSPTWFAGLEPGKIHMTGWTVHMREQPCQTHEIRTQSAVAADRSLPIYQTGAPLCDLTPWRNPEILNRKIKAVPRPALEKEGEKLLNEAAWRIEGPVGCGKSYFAHHLLLSASMPRIWLRGAPAHRRRFGLTRQLLDQLTAAASTPGELPATPRLDDEQLTAALRDELLSGADGSPLGDAGQLPVILEQLARSSIGPFYLVCDDCQSNSGEDLERLGGLLDHPDIGSRFRLLFIGRGGANLPPTHASHELAG